MERDDVVTPKVPPLRLRTATEADAGRVAALGARAFVAAFGPDNDPDDLRTYVEAAFAEERVRTEIAADTYLLLHDDADVLVGYAHLRAGAAPDVAGERPAELARLYVDPAAIGTGRGSALVRACLERAREDGFDTVWLGVWEHNARARAFYERWGFRRVGEQTFVLGTDVQTDHVMARPVRGADDEI